MRATFRQAGTTEPDKAGSHPSDNAILQMNPQPTADQHTHQRAVKKPFFRIIQRFYSCRQAQNQLNRKAAASFRRLRITNEQVCPDIKIKP